MRQRILSGWYACGLIVAACENQSAAVKVSNDVIRNDAENAPAAPLEGWRNLKFGMTLNEAMAELPTTRWNPVALSRCYDEMVTKGCFLVAQADDASLPLVAGIAFQAQLSFESTDSLKKIALIYRRETTVSSSDCLQAFKRAADRVAEQYGGVSYVPAPSSNDQDWKHLIERTKRGTQVAYGRQADGTYVTEVLRTHRPAKVSDDPRIASDQWEKVSHVWLLSSYILVNGKGHCGLTVNYDQGAGAQTQSRPRDDF